MTIQEKEPAPAWHGRRLGDVSGGGREVSCAVPGWRGDAPASRWRTGGVCSGFGAPGYLT